MGIQGMVTRTGWDGTTWGANQRITVDEAIRVNTINGAYASHEEAIKGSITAGKLADFVVLADDPHTVSAGQDQGHPDRPHGRRRRRRCIRRRRVDRWTGGPVDSVDGGPETAKLRGEFMRRIRLSAIGLALLVGATRRSGAGSGNREDHGGRAEGVRRHADAGHVVAQRRVRHERAARRRRARWSA